MYKRALATGRDVIFRLCNSPAVRSVNVSYIMVSWHFAGPNEAIQGQQ